MCFQACTERMATSLVRRKPDGNRQRCQTLEYGAPTFKSPQSNKVDGCARLRFVNPGRVSAKDGRTLLMLRIQRDEGVIGFYVSW